MYFSNNKQLENCLNPAHGLGWWREFAPVSQGTFQTPSEAQLPQEALPRAVHTAGSQLQGLMALTTLCTAETKPNPTSAPPEAKHSTEQSSGRFLGAGTRAEGSSLTMKPFWGSKCWCFEVTKCFPFPSLWFLGRLNPWLPIFSAGLPNAEVAERQTFLMLVNRTRQDGGAFPSTPCLESCTGTDFGCLASSLFSLG